VVSRLFAPSKLGFEKMKGRKPTAPHLKLLQGTSRPDRDVPDEIGFDAVTDFPPPPMHLNVDGVAMWSDLGPQLVAAKILQTVDLYALQQLCYCWQRHCAKQRAGMDITAAEDMALKALFSEFGLTSASRRKVTAGAEKKKDNRFASNGKAPDAGGPRSKPRGKRTA
jgi:phage terminase small subunit